MSENPELKRALEVISAWAEKTSKITDLPYGPLPEPRPVEPSSPPAEPGVDITVEDIEAAIKRLPPVPPAERRAPSEEAIEARIKLFRAAEFEWGRISERGGNEQKIASESQNALHELREAIKQALHDARAVDTYLLPRSTGSRAKGLVRVG